MQKRTTEVPEGRWTHDKFEGDPEGKWTHDKFDPGAEDVGRSATIIISNLDYEVTNEELKVIYIQFVKSTFLVLHVSHGNSAFFFFFELLPRRIAIFSLKFVCTMLSLTSGDRSC